ncbi:uncharacterized protein PV07_05936 [Cladophialophora immunda]|uniref:Xylanolytic transcriptional activator regulatory domain-containing protein n=1 Tax=Cladophialophora immunda TaxID=569365 RepID=A0A0D2D382_9EURO|nr:uncharacterized protein PV07_05936 [Cladophialophora immunda]KIW30174.1 hypothetical protein PV07_05936 [Cladophialophora immunda]
MSKPDAIHLEKKVEVHGLVADRRHEEELLAAQLEGEDAKIKRIVRRLDLRLVLMLALLYVWAFIDRGNFANANIAGMGDDLNLTKDNRYSVLAMIFFVGYILVDIPSTFLVRKIGATLMIPSIVVVITIAQGFCNTWGPLFACRVLLGIFEGGIIPSSMFLISVWYTRYEAHTRFVAGIASTGVSGLLAFGIEKMDGDSNIAGWRWIFIIEGVVTCVCGIVAYFILVDLPERATQKSFLGMPPFLTANEASLVHARIERDRGDSTAEKLTWSNMLIYARDWKVWEFSSYVFFNNTALYAFTYFLPVILQKSMGYSTSKAQLFTFPPYAVAVPWIMFCAWICDRLKVRGPVLLLNSTLYIIGVTITGFCSHPHVRYGGVFIGVLGITGNIPTNWAYQHNNVVGQGKRALCAAMMTTGGGLGGIVAGNIFRSQDAPDYRPALTICLAFQAFNMLLVAKNFVYFAWANRKADREEMIIEGQPAFRDLLRRHEKAVHDGKRCGRYESPGASLNSQVTAALQPNVFEPRGSLASPTVEGEDTPTRGLDDSLNWSNNLDIPTSASHRALNASVDPLSHSDTQGLACHGNTQLGAAYAGGQPHAGSEMPSTGGSQPLHMGVDRSGGRNDDLDFADLYGEFDGFNAFLDMTDFSTFIPPSTALDPSLHEQAFTAQLDEATLQGSSQVRHHNDVAAHGQQRNEQDTSFSRFGSPLPVLHFESRDPVARAPNEPSAASRPCWKISAVEYRQISARIQDFSHVLPKDFSLLSRHTISRFIEGAIKGLLEHLPFLHVPTFSVVDAAPELILAMAAIGAQFRFENGRAPMLFYAAKAVALEQIQCREKKQVEMFLWRSKSSPMDSTSTTVSTSNAVPSNNVPGAGNCEEEMETTNARLQTSQALLALLVMGAWGPQQLLKEAISLQSFAAALAREDGISGLKDSFPSGSHASDWHIWISAESRTRTKLMTYSMIQLISIAYNIPPLILTSEIDCCLPASAKEWNAKNAQEWEEVRRSSTTRELRFQESFESLFHNISPQAASMALSPVANYILVLAILQHIFLRQQTWTSSKKQNLSAEDIADSARALRCWQTRWERSPESNIDPSSAAGPVAFNSTALLRLAWIRLYSDLGPCRNLASRDVNLIASAFNNSPVLKRGPELIHPALQAAHALSVPVRMGINFVARTQTVSWSVQHSLSNLECAIFLSKWLETVAVASSTSALEKDELVLIQMIHSLLVETGLFDDNTITNIADRGDQKQKIRRLATAVARLWADIFKGNHVFEVVNIIGASLTTYAESMESAYTPANLG